MKAGQAKLVMAQMDDEASWFARVEACRRGGL
jgi:hypothetical protein